MGFSSFECAKSGISIPAYPHAGLPEEASRVVMVNEKNDTIEGVYDGYGRIDGMDIFSFAMGDPSGDSRDEFFDNYDKNVNKIKIVRADHYDGEDYDELDTSPGCEYQGYFYDEETKAAIRESVRDAEDNPGTGMSP